MPILWAWPCAIGVSMPPEQRDELDYNMSGYNIETLVVGESPKVKFPSGREVYDAMKLQGTHDIWTQAALAASRVRCRDILESREIAFVNTLEDLEEKYP